MIFSISQKILIISHINNFKKIYFVCIYFRPALVPVEEKGNSFPPDAQVASKNFLIFYLFNDQIFT